MSKVSLLSVGISLLVFCQVLVFPRGSFYEIQLNVSVRLLTGAGKMFSLPLKVP